MPEPDYVWLPRQDVLAFEELNRVVGAFVRLGVARVRLTGGEPLLRRDLPTLVEQIASTHAISDLSLTTNGILLTDLAEPLRRAGLGRVTVSLDTLKPERFRALTRQDELDRVRRGIESAVEVFGSLKIDTVVIRGVNDDEVLDLVDFARAHAAEVRFIEYMDVGGATRWSMQDVVSRRELLERLETAYGPVTPMPNLDWAPADRFALSDGSVVGIISSTTEPFCRTCDRVRLTADGVCLLCLYATGGLDVRTPLRSGATDDELVSLLAEHWRDRSSRGAEQRLTLDERRPLIPVDTLRKNTHLEMHTRGG
jgi:cyclic pyranopterin phosphate synthase